MANPLIKRCGGCGGGAGGAFIMTRRPGNGAELFLPSTGPVAMPAAGIPFGTWNAWTNIGAPPVNDFYITRLQARRTTVYAAFSNVAIEFGYAAGPTALEAIRPSGAIVDPTVDDLGFPWADLNVFNTKLPAGQQLQARVTDGQAAIWQLWVTGWDAAVPAFTPLNVTQPTGIGRYYPSNLSVPGLSVVCAAYPAYGAWLLVVDPAPNDMLVESVSTVTSAAMLQAQGQAFQIGIGPAGAEVAVGTFISGHGQAPTNCDPKVWVKAGERLSIRGSSSAITTRNALVKVTDL